VEVMSPLDSAFLRIEDRHTQLHIGSVAVFEGPPPAFPELLRLFAAKLHLVPRYRQRVQEVPLELGRPVWVDDPHFRLGYHLRHTALPAPGTDDQLRALVGRLMSQQLDRGKPLWETWVIEGLYGGRWAVVSKIHHCMVDGIAGTDLMGLVLDASPDVVPADPPPWSPDPEPGSVSLLTSAVTAVPHRPQALAGVLTGALRHPRRSAEEVTATAHGALEYLRLARPAAASSLSGPITSHRSWGWTTTTLADIKRVRQVFGGTLNDVVLAAVTRGFRDLLLARGEEPDDHAVRTLVPVSVRREDERGRFDNRVSAMVAELPVGIADPEERLLAVRAELDRLKTSGEARFGARLTDAAAFVPPVLLSVGLTGAFRLPQRSVVTVTTNVPGPRGPLYAAGRRMLSYHPYVPIAGRVRTGVAMTTYDGVLSFGVTADEDSTPDLQVLLDGIVAGMDELVALTPPLPPVPAPRGPDKFLPPVRLLNSRVTEP
jgi:diacylglycerol O-acyltransferase / wax synthase